jgi:hypothetical protein
MKENTQPFLEFRVEPLREEFESVLLWKIGWVKTKAEIVHTRKWGCTEPLEFRVEMSHLSGEKLLGTDGLVRQGRMRLWFSRDFPKSPLCTNCQGQSSEEKAPSLYPFGLISAQGFSQGLPLSRPDLKSHWSSFFLREAWNFSLFNRSVKSNA